MVERLLEDPEDVLHFDDKTFISNYRLPHVMGWENAIYEFPENSGLPTYRLPHNRNCNQHYWDQQKRHGALLVVVQVTNALRFFAKSDFQSEVAFVYLISSWRSAGCLVTDLRVDCRAW